jgi:hypothetical protein
VWFPKVVQFRTLIVVGSPRPNSVALIQKEVQVRTFVVGGSTGTTGTNGVVLVRKRVQSHAFVALGSATADSIVGGLRVDILCRHSGKLSVRGQMNWCGIAS